MSNDPVKSTRTSGRISVPAALGALALMVGAIVFGILGPRMGQRGLRLVGTPLSEVRDFGIEVYGAWFLGGSWKGEPSEERFTQVESLGFQSEGSSVLDLDVVGGAVAHWFVRPGGETPILVLELLDPGRFIHFDPLGRQRPLVTGDRIEESIELRSVPWAREAGNAFRRGPAVRELLSSGSLGVVVLGLGDHAVVIIAPGLEPAVEVADRIEPVIEPDGEPEVASLGCSLEPGCSDET
jgi:hypothetical protein